MSIETATKSTKNWTIFEIFGIFFENVINLVEKPILREFKYDTKSGHFYLICSLLFIVIIIPTGFAFVCTIGWQ